MPHPPHHPIILRALFGLHPKAATVNHAMSSIVMHSLPSTPVSENPPKNWRCPTESCAATMSARFLRSECNMHSSLHLTTVALFFIEELLPLPLRTGYGIRSAFLLLHRASLSHLFTPVILSRIYFHLAAHPQCPKYHNDCFPKSRDCRLV